jgi:diguanylate cyclase (GGDEF)-like protein
MDQYEGKVKNMILNHSIGIIDKTSENILDEMLHRYPDFIRSNLTEKAVQLKNENALALLKNKDIDSLYVLFFSQGKLFYLLDTSKEDRGEAGEIFIPEEMKVFEKVLKSQKKRTHIQKKLKSLGFTLIKPIIQDKKVIAFLVVDYTQSSLSSLSRLLTLSVDILAIALLLAMIIFAFVIYYIFHISYTKYKIYYNPQTNTLNRIYLSENYEKIEFHKYYVALADLDFFKRINTLYGKKNGDEIIVLVIKKIVSLLKKSDILIEYSGESFLLLIAKNQTSEKRFKHLLEEIRLLIEETSFQIAKERIYLTISIGALIHTDLEKSLQDVIHKADTALYDTKHQGRNQIGYFDTTKSKRMYREKLKELIESDKLVCHYQAIRNLEDNSLHHYEALLRIEDGKSIIFPDEILPNIEDSHLYSYLTKRIIQFNIKKLQHDPKIKISINLSADDLVNDSILSLLAQHADLSNRLYLEILENKSIDYAKVELYIQKLKRFGYKICIDDFGAGYSNLNHLLNLSIDYLKIDGSIIKEIYHDKRAYSLVKTFALFCKQNDIEVIAEYIENREILDILKSFGITYGQGYYFAKALPYDELDKAHL